MAHRPLSIEEIESLAGTRDAGTHVEYPTQGLQPYYHWLIRTLNELVQCSAGALRVSRDDASETHVRVAPGRALLSGVLLVFEGGSIDLAPHNNLTALVWLQSNAGAASLGHASQAQGWPAQPHLKLAEVTLSEGVITAILDRRMETMLAAGDPVLRSCTNATRPTPGTPGRVIFNTDDSNLNIDTGSAWILPDGSAT